jgi:hypothetical protein
VTWAASRGHSGMIIMLLSSELANDHNHAMRCAALILAQRNQHSLVVETLQANLSQTEAHWESLLAM